MVFAPFASSAVAAFDRGRRVSEARSPAFTAANSSRQWVGSFGAGIRLAAFIPLELSVVRAVTRPAHGWSFDVSFRTGF